MNARELREIARQAIEKREDAEITQIFYEIEKAAKGGKMKVEIPLIVNGSTRFKNNLKKELTERNLWGYISGALLRVSWEENNPYYNENEF